MKINLTQNVAIDPTLPIGPVRGFTNSSMFIEILGVPDKIGGCEVARVDVTVVNADGAPITGTAERDGCLRRILFAESNFRSYGTIENGVKVSVMLARPDGTSFLTVFGVGNVDIIKGDPSAEPGDQTRTFVVKGDDVYLKSEIVDGVQHYVVQVIEYDPEIGWGANWIGDYILVDGEFVEVADAE